MGSKYVIFEVRDDFLYKRSTSEMTFRSPKMTSRFGFPDRRTSDLEFDDRSEVIHVRNGHLTIGRSSKGETYLDILTTGERERDRRDRYVVKSSR